jgi:hypothetical protein
LDSKTHVFDRNSTAYDDSRIIAPRTDRSLLRRSAFSARGRGRKSNVESVDHESKKTKRRSKRREPAEPLIQTDKDEVKSVPWNKSEGVILYDQPVNMSEWIDLGSASLESDDSQRGILSRVHDAESQLRSQISQEEGKQDQDNEKDNHDDAKEQVIKTINNDDRSNIPPPLPSQQASVVAQDGPKRPTMKRTSETPAAVIAHKQEKRSSWLTSLFQDKKNANNNNNNNSGKKSPSSSSSAALSTSSPTATAIQITSNNGSSSPLSTLATLFTRSLSLKSNASSNLSTSSSLHSTVTSANIEEQGKKKRSSRLEIPPPSQRTFFNTNRLPLHVERAIYRLSHIKLANPKRPLSQQVLISNLMFWYLSIQQNDHQLQQQQMLANEHGLTLETIAPLTPKKMGNSKMSRLIHSAKKKKGELVPIKSSKHNVQFNLPSIPTHHPSIEDEEDNVPLSHFKN